ncbi:MAG TPA: dockerin type I domain-containing protein, partial [Candidatus Saccharimonadales bacterium]|nr:dockerin type I domain-containing protein [Candidatus Saccharimonadales bacterium]
TTLSYTPNTTSAAPLQKQVGDNISFDVMLDPGTNQVSFVKLEMDYDPAKLQPASIPFTVNTDAFPATVEGPFIDNGKVIVTLTVGPDPSKAIKQVTKVGTINFTSITATTGGTTSISFGTSSQILSIAPNDQANENVLSTTNPGYLSILPVDIASPTPTPEPPTPTNAQCPERAVPPPGCSYQGDNTPPACNSQLVCSPTPTRIPTIAINPSPACTPYVPIGSTGSIPPSYIYPTLPPGGSYCPDLTPSPTPIPLTSVLSFNVFLHGIGKGGDSANPTSDGNPNPLHPQRQFTAEILNQQNQIVASLSGTMNFNNSTGNFTSTINAGNELSSGFYSVRLKTSQFLNRLVPGIQTITNGTNNQLPAVYMIVGDVNEDNVMNIVDYNLLIGCYSDLSPAVSCTPTQKIATDLNDDGDVNQFDYNLFLRELTSQSGQ